MQESNIIFFLHLRSIGRLTDFKFNRVVLSRPPIDPFFLQSVYSYASGD
jgi:hypothetical protein